MNEYDPGPGVGPEKLPEIAADAARLLAATGEGRADGERKRLRESLAAVRRCADAVERRFGAAAAELPPACEWLLDNAPLALRQGREALAALRGAKELRLCRDGALPFALARALLRSGGGRADAERCLLFLGGFQRVTPLRRRELLLFPAALRGAAIEGLAAVCDRLLASADGDSLDASFEALFSALRFAEGADWEELLEAADPSGAILALDPSGDYPRMDRGTRQAYLERLELLSRAEGCPEQDLARRLIDRAAAEGRHVGFLLFEGEKPGDERPYIAAVLALTVFLSLMLGRAAGGILAAPLLLLPVSELVKGVMDAALLRAIPPRRLPRMDVSGGVGAEGKTLCVVTALLTSPESAEALCRRLEEFRCANRGAGENLLFGVLADLPAADSADAETDEAVLRAARQAVTALNRRCGGGFFLFTRPRRFDGERWSGHERKRGALLELARLLADEPTELRVAGDRDALAGTRFLLTLDSDTQMSPGAAAELIGAMLHPLNRPELDENGVVRKGFGLIHPRLATELSSASATDFALIFAGPGGSDPYGSLVNELYSSAFDSGGFAGKGILDAETLLRSAAARLPEGRVLSHDALEGAILRGGFLGDVEFTDAFPARPLAWYRRLHRWVRGDWQNAPWVFRRGAGLRPIERWRLFDSLRRSLAAPLTLAAILAGFFLPAPSLRLSAWTALLALLSRLIASLAEAGRRPAGQPRLRRATRLLGGVGGALVQSFIRLWLLPFEAWICLTAALSSLWRMAVTKRRLLEWETAAQSDRRSGGLGEALRAMAVPAALGLACLLFAPSVIARAAGLLWLLSPAALTALGLPARSEEPLSRAERAYLLERAGETWRYFTENLSPQTHFLPPDNVQSRPPIGAAERCSPTNLGLAAAAAAAACDLSLAKPEEALAYLRRLIGAMEALPRCLGHFYNWYDTRTLRPLRPPMISTVDSGNCYASLLTAAAFCREQGDEALAARIGALLEPMDFAPLYDRSHGLFWISFDPARGCGVGGHYDLLASEAMLTSYLAVAKGDAPVKHWRRLGRGQLQKDGFRGLASWTGTVFEYLMPFLFLPLEHGSLLYESARFCLYAQRRAAAPGQPWGASESAYFSLDGALNYRYKAHGCPALALKRGMGADRVAAPYASFLALAVSPRAAVRNLRRFERLGMLGPWGYYDALDCTPGRCRSERGEVVACTMAHHAGMSLLAAANALCGGSVRRRFMGEAFAASCRLLLQEKLDDGTPAPQRKEAAPERAPLPEPGRWRRRGGPEDEGLCLLSNGVYHLLADGRGGSRAALGEERLVYDGSPLLLLDGEPLLPGRTESWDFGEDGASWRVETETLSLRAELFAAASELGEGRELRLTAKRAGRFRLALVLRPVLALRRDWESHASFWRLGLWAEERGDALLLRRLARGSCPEHWLCVAGDRPLRFEADERGGLGWLARPLVRAEAELNADAGEELTLRFALCAAPEADAALAGARRILASSPLERGGMVGSAAALLGLSAAELGAAEELLAPLTAPLPRGAAPKRELWRYGLSGELPILCCRAGARDGEALLRRFLLLRSAGVEADFVFFCEEPGAYSSPFRRRIGQLLARYALEPLLGARGGVHWLPAEAAAAVESRSAAAAAGPVPRLLPPSFERLRGEPPRCAFRGRSFVFETDGTLPERPWQQLLTNGRLGCLVTGSGCAFLWLDNARELPLTPPPRLPEEAGAETLCALVGERSLSLFAANDGIPCRVRYAPGLAEWEKTLGGRRVKTTVFVSRDPAARITLVEGAEGLRLRWTLRPSLSADDPEALRCRTDDGLFCAENPACVRPELRFWAGSSRPAAIEAGDGLLLACEAEGPTVFACGCCGEAALRGLLKPAAALAALRESARGWEERCAAFELESGEAALDRYMSPWAVYQTLAGRLYGRCSLYQIGGAYGFRDQLQDAANLLLLEPELLRERLLDACRHQYAEGDVMHWWHELPGGDRGVRTRCSDDLLWLVWALCEYCEATGDTAICAREEPGLSSPPLQSGERDRYEAAVPGAPLTVLAHARNALACCLERGFGPHGLPLMGGGDWNDGLDRIGGESVWLGWFLASVEARFAELLGRLGEAGGEELRGQAAAVARAAENSFNGRFYERGFRPDGTPYGEDRLDSLAQSWAVLSGFGDPARARTALTAALGRLVDREHRLVKLFDPPWSADEPDPGYIAGCGEGFRENGGQYTHGAVWLAMACLRAGLRREGLELLRLLLPETHDARVYGAEPYVLAADVYAAPGREGEAGWSWYTGSSGWYFRAVCEELLGLRRRNGALALRRLGFDCRASVLGHELRFSPEGVSADGKAPAEENFIELGKKTSSNWGLPKRGRI